MLSPLSDSGFLGQRVDFVFYTVLLLSIFAFLAGESFFLLKKVQGKGSQGIEKKHFELAWSLIPLLVLLLLTFVQTQFFSPIQLKSFDSEKSAIINAPRNLPTETKNIKEEIPKSLENKKLNSAVRM